VLADLRSVVTWRPAQCPGTHPGVPDVLRQVLTPGRRTIGAPTFMHVPLKKRRCPPACRSQVPGRDDVPAVALLDTGWATALLDHALRHCRAKLRCECQGNGVGLSAGMRCRLNARPSAATLASFIVPCPQSFRRTPTLHIAPGERFRANFVFFLEPSSRFPRGPLRGSRSALTRRSAPSSLA
jgi:hypothetical protein